MAQDLLIKITENGYFDLEVGESDLGSVDGMETTVAVLLFTDARAAPSEVNDIEKRRGWVGNILRPEELGGMLWLIAQIRNEQTDRNKIVRWAESSLLPLVTAGMASEIRVVADQDGTRTIKLTVEIVIQGGETLKLDYWINTKLGNLVNRETS